MAKSIPNYLDVFQNRLERLRTKIKEEYHKPKRERSKHNLKKFVREARELRDCIVEVREDHALKCPHCHKKI
jgi:hypothetical protein